MTRVRLSYRTARPETRGIPYFPAGDRSGQVLHMPVVRIFVRLWVPPRAATATDPPDPRYPRRTPEAILDTGAPLSLFPFAVWQPFAADVRWFDQPPADRDRRVTILGGHFPYRLGRLRLGAFDRYNNRFPAVWTPAWFLTADDPAAPKQAVLGLHTRLFDARRLRCEAAPDDPLGQRWWLEDA